MTQAAAHVSEKAFPLDVPSGVEMPTVKQALQGPVADLIRSTWIELGADHSDGGAYLQSLTEQNALGYPYSGDPLAVAIVSTAPEAYWIEVGRAGFHLPSSWGRGGGKWKYGKDGQRYATVPFRHRSPIAAGGGSTPGRVRTAMPSAIYSQALQLESGQRLGGFGDAYKQSKSYNFFRQIHPDFPRNLGGDGYTWKTSPFEGMVRKTVETPGGGRHTEYTTFRTITPDSPGWYIPPTPAHHVAERALEAAAPEIARILDEAAAIDLAAAIVAATVGLL
jgi:hypothetical protein